MKSTRLADILLRQKRITHEQLDHVIGAISTNGGTLVSQLISQNLFSEEGITDFIAKSLWSPYCRPGNDSRA